MEAATEAATEATMEAATEVTTEATTEAAGEATTEMGIMITTTDGGAEDGGAESILGPITTVTTTPIRNQADPTVITTIGAV